MPRIFHRLAVFLMAMPLAACCPCLQQQAPQVHVTTASAPSVPAALHVGPKAGDVLHVTIENQNDLSGDYTVGPDGNITMPLAGKIAVAGQPNSALSGVIGDAYRAGYLVDPKVTVEVKSK